MALHPARPPRDESGQGEEFELSGQSQRYDLKHDADIISWRYDCFRLRDFDHLDALALAVRRDVARPDVEALLDRGASHVEVALILL